MPKFKTDGKFSCLFCFALMDEPRDYNLAYSCPNCAAFCVVEEPESMFMVIDNAADHFGVEPEDIEIRSEEFDILTEFKGDPLETGQLLHIFFARVRLHQEPDSQSQLESNSDPNSSPQTTG